MGLLGRGRARLEPADRALLAMGVAAVERQQHACSVVGGDTIRLTAPFYGTITLDDLRARVADTERDDWPELVYDHVMRTIAVLETGHRDVVDLDDFDAVRPALRTRVYPESLAGGGDVVAWEYAPGLVETLVVQMPHTLRSIAPGTAETWPVPVDDLIDIGRAGVRELGALTTTEHTVDEVTLTELRAETVYAPVHAAWLDTYLPDAAQPVHVAVPVPNLLIVHTGADRPPAALCDLAARMYADGPGSLSPDVFRWADGLLSTS